MNVMTEKQLVSSEEDAIVIRYGLELIINSIISITILFSIGTLLGFFKETVVFYLTYLFLKKNTGGYHANSHIGCIQQFNLSCLAMFLLYKHGLLPIYETGLLFVMVFSVFIFAPIEDRNKKIPAEMFQSHKRKCRGKAIFLLVLGLVLKVSNIRHNTLYDFFYLGILMVCITILFGYLKKRLTKDGE